MPNDDVKLIRRTIEGDRSAYGELVRRYQDRLYNTVYRLLLHAEDSRDVVQEAFINAFESLERFHGGAQFFTWLYRIAVNAAISHKRRRREAVSLDRGDHTNQRIPEPTDESCDHEPGSALERREAEMALYTGLAKLSPDHRAVLVLRDLDGQKYEEIAAVLNLPIGTVRSRIHRARIELRDILSAGMNETERSGMRVENDRQ